MGNCQLLKENFVSESKFDVSEICMKIKYGWMQECGCLIGGGMSGGELICCCVHGRTSDRRCVNDGQT